MICMPSWIIFLWSAYIWWGTAAGGIPALDYALSHPNRVRSLVVANTIGGVQDDEYLEVQHRLRPPEIQNLPVELRELGPSYRGTNPEGAKRWLEIDEASRPDGPIRMQPVREPITYSRLQTMRVPTLVVSGEADLLSPPALMRMLAEHIPTSRFASLPEAGTRRVLGTTGGVERDCAGVHRPALVNALARPIRRNETTPQHK